MSETDWLRSRDPATMLDFLADRASERKLRLFAVACCYRVKKHAGDDAVRGAIEASERYADGFMSYEDFTAVQKTLRRSHPLMLDSAIAAARSCSQQALTAASIAAWEPILEVDQMRGLSPDFEVAAAIAHRTRTAESKSQAALLREIFGNPFRSLAIRPVWLTPEVVAIARRIYQERTFSEVFRLAQALENSGCNDRLMIGHCQASLDHVRGCWLLDSLLGRE